MPIIKPSAAFKQDADWVSAQVRAYIKDQVATHVDTVQDVRDNDFEQTRFLYVRERGAIYRLDLSAGGNDDGNMTLRDNLGRVYLRVALTLTKSDVGLGNVDNTSDANKPVSSAQAAALVSRAGDTMTGPLSLQLFTPSIFFRSPGNVNTCRLMANISDTVSGGFIFYRNGEAIVRIGEGNGLQVIGNASISGSLAKGSGTFAIDHPMDPFNKDLFHGFVEAPRYDLIYRGVAKLEDGVAVVDIDAASNLSPGTFEALTTNAVVTSLQNQDGFARVRPGPIEGGKFTIHCEDAASTDEIAWVVIAERNDPFVKHLDDNCDEDGRFIPEREKEA